MTRKQIKELVMFVLGHVDYDIQKSFDPETAEEPEYAKAEMERVIDAVEKHLKKISKKNAK